jgi:hypothetical protein
MNDQCQFPSQLSASIALCCCEERGTYLDKRKERALVLGSQLLRFALSRHDSGILSLAVISSNNKKSERM